MAGPQHSRCKNWFGDWAAGYEDSGKATRPELAALYKAMFVDSPQFCFSASLEDVKQISHPLLVLAGKDMFHPTQVARDIAANAPNAQYQETWRDEDWSPDVDARIEAFLSMHGTAGGVSG